MTRLKLFLIVFFINSLVFAGDFNLSVSPYISLKNSTSQEALFFSGYINSDSSKKCSLLEWNERMVFYYGANFDCSLSNKKNKYIFSGDLSSALPYNQGSMTDTDWNTALVKKTESEFDNIIDFNFSAKTKFSYQRELSKEFFIEPSISISYDYLSFKGENGRGWYYLDTSEPHYYPDGTYHLAGINYRSHKAASFIGLSLKKKFNSLSLALGAEVSPFTFVLVSDRHLGSSSYYETDDYIYAPFKNFNFFMEADYDINSRLALMFNASFNYFIFTKGDEYYDWDDSSSDTLCGQKAGYSYWDCKIKTGIKIKIF